MKQPTQISIAISGIAILLYSTILAILPFNLYTANSITFINGTNTNNSISNSNAFNHTKLKVVASFFPIYEFVKSVGRNRVDASVFIPVGSEPHDFDPTIQQIQNANSADMLAYNGAGMEATWINKLSPKFVVDTSNGINLLVANGLDIHAPTDPHIWLDPILAIQQVENIRDGLIKVDPKYAVYYNQNAEKFIGQLKALDASIRSQLSSSNCEKRDFVAFHQAFGYFAKRYGLNQHSIHEGLTPEGEILPQRLVQVVQLAHNLGIHIIYSEDLIDPRSSQAIAQEIPNGKVIVLSPIEGINKQEQQDGIGYRDKMNQDTSSLKVGLQCKK
jgi:zinc transport system substrate-binding protein